MTDTFSINTTSEWSIISSSTQVSFTRPDDDNTATYRYNGTNNELVKTTIGILETMQSYSTEDSPEITPEELWLLAEEIYKSNPSPYEEIISINSDGSISGGKTGTGIAVNNFEKTSEHYSSPYSDGGEDITVDEIYDMTEFLLGQAGFKDSDTPISFMGITIIGDEGI